MFCTNCGEKLSPDAKFCTSCGTPTPQAQQPAPTPAAQPAQDVPPAITSQPAGAAPSQPPKKKKSRVGVIILVCLLVGLFVVGGLITGVVLLLRAPAVRDALNFPPKATATALASLPPETALPTPAATSLPRPQAGNVTAFQGNARITPAGSVAYFFISPGDWLFHMVGGADTATAIWYDFDLENLCYLTDGLMEEKLLFIHKDTGRPCYVDMADWSQMHFMTEDAAVVTESERLYWNSTHLFLVNAEQGLIYQASLDDITQWTSFYFDPELLPVGDDYTCLVTEDQFYLYIEETDSTYSMLKTIDLATGEAATIAEDIFPIQEMALRDGVLYATFDIEDAEGYTMFYLPEGETGAEGFQWISANFSAFCLDDTQLYTWGNAEGLLAFSADGSSYETLLPYTTPDSAESMQFLDGYLYVELDRAELLLRLNTAVSGLDPHYLDEVEGRWVPWAAGSMAEPQADVPPSEESGAPYTLTFHTDEASLMGQGTEYIYLRHLSAVREDDGYYCEVEVHNGYDDMAGITVHALVYDGDQEIGAFIVTKGEDFYKAEDMTFRYKIWDDILGTGAYDVYFYLYFTPYD